MGRNPQHLGEHPYIGESFDTFLEEEGTLEECTEIAKIRVGKFIEDAMENAGKNVEKCVNCGKDTEYTFDTSIHLRMCYVEGVGQLCKECWNKIYS